MTTEKGRKPSNRKPRVAKISKAGMADAAASLEAVPAPPATSEPAPGKPASRRTTGVQRQPSTRKPRVARIAKPEVAEAAATPEAAPVPPPSSEPALAPGPVFALPDDREGGFVEPPPELVAPGSPRPAEDARPAEQEALVSPTDERWLVAADLGSLSIIGALAFLNIAGTGGAVRVVLALLFVTFVPGWAVARAAGLAGGLTGIAIAVLASLTICAAASTVMVWASSWHPLMLLTGLGALSAVAILWSLPPAFVAAQLRR